MAIKILIPCAGIGSRFIAGLNKLPKQYQILFDNVTVLDQTLSIFLDIEVIDQIVLVVSHDDQYIDSIIDKYDSTKIIVARVGGKTRAETVYNGLRSINNGTNDDDWILVHDSARCLIKKNTVINMINALKNDHVGGILAISATDTIKSVHNSIVSKTLDRETIYLAQTPQMFRYKILYESMSKHELYKITDEASAVEMLGFAVKILVGDASNIKITYIEDLDYAKFLLTKSR